MRRAARRGPSAGGEEDLLAPSTPGAAAQTSAVKVLVLSCFLATFVFYFERTGFPIVFTHAAKGIGEGLDETTKGQVRNALRGGTRPAVKLPQLRALPSPTLLSLLSLLSL